MKQMRLIDADALIEAMNDYTDYKGYLVCDPEVIIDHAPTVERPHGEWIDKVYTDVCSCCGMESEYQTLYCGGCGAFMKNGFPSCGYGEARKEGEAE